MSRCALRTAIYARIATCEESAVVTQGEILDEVTAHLRNAVALHLEGEDLAALGFAAVPAISHDLRGSWGVGDWDADTVDSRDAGVARPCR
jgi:hypothetical protein